MTPHSPAANQTTEPASRLPSRLEGERAFTLIEIALVVVLLAVMSTIAASRFGVIDTWRQKTSIRSFINTWEFFIASQARFRGESYRMTIDIDRGTYMIRREVPVEGPRVKQVDYLKNFRTKSENERRAREEQERTMNIEDEFKEEDIREGDALENIFYRVVFRDPNGNYRLGIPIEFPSFEKEIKLADGISFQDISVRGEESTAGSVAIRFSSTGATEFAVIHLVASEQVFTAVMNPATRKVTLTAGDTDYQYGNRGSR